MKSGQFSDLWPDAVARHRAESIVRSIQDRICQGVLDLEGPDGGKFHEDIWYRSDKREGGGVTRILQSGNIFEKAGVNISVVSAKLNAKAIASMRSNHAALANINAQEPLIFFATGVSVVIHGRNPHVPTMHCNYRYFEVNINDKEKVWWIGGGTDLTPIYIYEQDCVHFHSVQKQACDKFSADLYPKFKKWCDEYFYITHRQEGRGIGGIFFDDVDYMPFDEGMNFLKTCGFAVNDAYFPIVTRHCNDHTNEHEQHWQQIRRGRYVEFNLIYDRGTKFGLHTPNARIESILMSLPLTARWEYCHEPEPDSREEKLVNVLKNPIDWLGNFTGSS